MIATIPDDLATRLGRDHSSVLQEIAISLYKLERLTLLQAAQLAETDRIRFQRMLRERGLPLNYSREDVQRDLLAAEKMTSE